MDASPGPLCGSPPYVVHASVAGDGRGGDGGRVWLRAGAADGRTDAISQCGARILGAGPGWLVRCAGVADAAADEPGRDLFGRDGAWGAAARGVVRAGAGRRARARWSAGRVRHR